MSAAALGQAASTAGGDEAALRLYEIYRARRQQSALQGDAIHRD